MELPRLQNATQTTTDFDEVAIHLNRFHGIDRTLASGRLHTLKATMGLQGDDNVVFDMTGNVYAPVSSDYLGTLTEGGGRPQQQ